ncbi:hypothetical protein SCAR479_06242 [Seiridium cardinale]|uniref:Major facilitator superfamily (MFS) profile domain-containing protein n=1 Tax=Seiridium cardinale TaxID=138064 RepID=A0ABR2XU19_9PEZI
MASHSSCKGSEPRRFDEFHVRNPFNGLERHDIDRRVHDLYLKAQFSRKDYSDLYQGAFLVQDRTRVVVGQEQSPNATASSHDGDSHPPKTVGILRSPFDPGEAAFEHWKLSLVDKEKRVVVDEEEKALMKLERRRITAQGISRWHWWRETWIQLRAYPAKVYWLIVCCSLGAVVQGFDETAVNGAQVFYSKTLQLDQGSIRLGAVNGAPYALSAVMCLFNSVLNNWLGRRGVIFLTCFMSCVWCLAQSLSSSWELLFLFRLLLGLGIGPKSATIPIYASECAPAQIRGGLVMMWQMWTAFGLLLGYAFGVAFWDAGGSCRVDGSIELPCSLNWRLMLGAAMIPPLIPLMYIFTLPESPRWLMRKAILCNDREKEKRLYRQAYNSLKQLNRTALQASREFVWLYYSLRGEARSNEHDKSTNIHTIKQLWTHRRTRRALLASIITMFLQQFCGVNIIAYYSTSVLQQHLNGHYQVQVGDGRDPYYYSLGFGALNWLFAFPAALFMDTLGRRTLLLLTFPFLAIFQATMAISLTAPIGNDASIGGFVTSMYLFCIFYSIGEGPVPFVYAAESMPLHHRDHGMGIVTFVNWTFNFILALTFPNFLSAFQPPGAFGWYAVWCFIGWILILFFVRETKQERLEDMDLIFAAKSAHHVRFAFVELDWFFKHGWKIWSKSRKEKPSFLDYLSRIQGVPPEEFAVLHPPAEIYPMGDVPAGGSSHSSVADDRYGSM